MLLGRDFLPEEGEPGRDRVVILSNRFWSKHFGADREIIGKEIRMNGEPYTVVGVMPPGMHDRLPMQFGCRWSSHQNSKKTTTRISFW